MKKKPLRFLLLVIGLVSIPLSFPFISDTFIAPLYALQEQEREEDELSLVEERAGLKDVDFQFLTSNKQGYLGEKIPIEIMAHQPVTEVAVVLPPETVIESSLFPEGITIEQMETDQWELLSEAPQSNWLLPLAFEEEGTYEVMVGEERLAVEIQGSPEEGEEGQKEAQESDREEAGPENEEQQEAYTPDQTEQTSQPLHYDANDPGNLYLLGEDVRTIEVDNWVDFMNAIQDTNYNHIVLTADFESPDQPLLGLDGAGTTTTSNFTLRNSGGLAQNPNTSLNPNGGLAYLDNRKSNISRTLIIDGQGKHKIDFRAVSVGFFDRTVNTIENIPWDITLQNMEIYSGNYFGPIQFNNLSDANQRISTMRYHNVTHVGNQLFHGFHATAILSGHVSSHQMNPYDAGLGREWRINATNQANFEVGYMEVREGADVHLSTISSGNIWFRHSSNPTFTIGDDAKVTIVAGGGGTDGDTGEAWGANMFFAHNSVLTVGERAILDLTTKDNHSAITTEGWTEGRTSHIYLLEDSTVRIRSTGRTHAIGDWSNWDWRNIITLPRSLNNSINLRKGSTLDIEATNQNQAQAHVIYFHRGGDINIDEDATLNILSDTLSPIQSLISSGWIAPNANNIHININDAAKVNLEKTRDVSGSTSLIRNSIINVSNQSIKQWNYGNRGEESDFNWSNLLSLNATISGQGAPINNNTASTTVTAVNAEIAENARVNFTPRAQRLLFENIPPVEIALDPLTNDRSQRNSYTITGETSPGAYVRFSRDLSLPQPTLDTVVNAEGETEWFHVIAEEDGSFEFDLSQFDAFDYFRGQEVVTATAFLNGRRDETSVIVDGVDPRDPLNPDVDVDPDNRPTLPENQGLISIDFISQFDFGYVPIRSSQAYYPALPQKLRNAEDDPAGGKRPNYVQISDRREESTGWTLSARLDEAGFFSEEGHQLRGVQLLLNNIRMATTSSNTSSAPTYWGSRELNAGRQILAKAEEGQGSGTWVQRFGDGETMDQSVMLEVPINATPQATSYTGIIHWELSFVPEMD